MPRHTWLAFSLWVALADCLGPAWTGTQVDLTVLNWDRLRVNTIRDTVYLNGGSLWWQKEYSDDQPDLRLDNTAEANVYYFGLGETFDTSTTNLTALLHVMPTTGVQSAGNLALTYFDGAMFANDEQFYLYGGITRKFDDDPPPAEDYTIGYERYEYDGHREKWRSGFRGDKLDNDVTMYVSNGASVSAPSENLGFYFSGIQRKDRGPIYLHGIHDNMTEITESDTFVTVDMSKMRGNKWANHTLPEYVVGRANAEAVWVPVSGKGIVVILGGVINPAALDGWSTPSKEDQSESKKVSPGFMESVSVYDVAENKWYIQKTTGDIPPQLARFCSVYASAPDDSSHNIYIYGGNNGTSPLDPPSDDVYVLSLPSFEWIKLYSGVKEHGRTGHRCVKPYPDQMLVLGGQYMDVTKPLGGGFIQVLNLNTGRFQNKYNSAHEEYRVPNMVAGRIGGGPAGGATKTSPSSWTNDSLASVFKTKYPGTIKTWYPYPQVRSVHEKRGTKFPGWAGAIIGVVLGVILIACALAFWLIRRRRKQQQYRSSHNPSISEPDTSTMTRVARWIQGSGGDSAVPKSGDTVSTEYGAQSEGTAVSRGFLPEVGGEPVHELPPETTKVFPAELPTPYNKPDSSPAPSSTGGGFRSPVSPATPGEEGSNQEEGRPTHGRQMSNVSSAPSMSIADVISEDGEKDTKGHAMRPSIVSNFSELSSTPSSFSEQGTWTGLGINADGKLSPTREDKE
ncbi:uncharacterized protein BDW47DRAFT_117778 [Aspergillus candidus]|uniref:Kelch repeat protein n=1 Tax=Aspergillus candidus TaxID=41067 RepID=A0A2I2FB04_ASPCN|nr:hypothetical protein BDW47DRAFT_117778 [Aspergillus candidus]PLB37796.1 hypothetical protein BDW47DRAFT_117778 [Aspergillus candidus]